MKPTLLLPDAHVEMIDAARFYAARTPGLGLTFLDAVERAVADIRQSPKRWPMVRRGIRRRLVAQFPYGVLYREDPEEIVIMAVMHLHRRPGYWRGRT
jgi:toxin ParE1/3/4